MAPLNSRHRRRAVVLSALVLVAATVGFAHPAAAADPPRHGDQLRICDPTGCYVVWRVVDSDDDGVSDADELVAGTDPYDARSRPGLTVVVQLAADRTLPSFEAGLGAFLAFPADILAAREKFADDPLGAFPLHDRKDALTRMGIDLGQLADFGIDPGLDGFTIGLGSVGGKDSLATTRIGGLDARLIGFSDPGLDFGEDHGGVDSVTTVGGGKGTMTTFKDGATRTTVGVSGRPGDSVSTWTNKDGTMGDTVFTHKEQSSDGDMRTSSETQTTVTPGGQTTNVSTEVVHEYAGGASSSLFTSVQNVYDEKGTVIGTVTTTIVSYISADGSYASTATTITACSSGGECSDVSDSYEDTDMNDDDEEYRDPDADTTVVTFEVVDGVLRTRGAAVRVVEGWAAPGFENVPRDPGDPTVIALVDPELGDTYLLVEPLRVTHAQPEVRPDLPNPMQAAPPPQSGGVCDSLCA